MANNDNANETDRNPFTQPRFLVAAIFMLGLLVMLVWLLVRGGDEEPQATDEPTSAPTETPTDQEASSSSESETGGGTESESTSPADASWCGLEAVELEGTLTRAPADTEWQYVGTTAVPTLAEHGPGVTENDGLRHCFAQTPEGAVLAAINYLISSNVPELQGQVAEYLVVDGPLRDAALAESSQLADPTEDSGTRLAVQGFRLLAYSGTNAEVDVLMTSSAGDGYVSFVLPFVWQNGEWLLDMQSEAEITRSFAEVRSPTGYVIWRDA